MTSASIDLTTGRADVAVVGIVNWREVVRTVQAAGYELGTESIELMLEGMSCASCVQRVERAIKAVPGVLEASVNLASQKTMVTVVSGVVQVADIEGAVHRAGYETHRSGQAPPASEAALGARELRSLGRSLIVAVVLTTPVVILEMGSHLIPAIHQFVMDWIGMQESRYLQMALATLVLFGPGLRFFGKGLPALLHGRPDMNSLVAVGSAVAWAYSVVATVAPEILPDGAANLYYEAAAVIITFILLGRMLEKRAKGRTGEAIKHLMALQPKTARVLRNGEAVEIPLDRVAVDDIVVVRPGEKVAVDGEVIEGSSYVDESMVTGEPIPTAKCLGTEVIGGTINKTGAFSFRATKVGSDTVLAQIIRMVETTQGSKLPIQALVDRVTAWFVPAVMIIAATTFLVWLIFGPEPALTFALVNAVAVLIIACPCAMGLATPTSITVGTGRAAEIGVLFRKGEALQTLQDAKIIALDKTGTLTKGRPELTDLLTPDGFDRDEVLALVASVERPSEHPNAEAIVEAARRSGLVMQACEAFEAMPGVGVRGRAGGRLVEIGADRLIRSLGLDNVYFADEAARLADQGKSPFYAVIDGRLAAMIAVADPIKATTPRAIEALHGLGLKIAMITGDNNRTARAIARKLGIDQIVAEVLPDGKVEAIQQLRRNGRKVAFVGDGINDAPALAEADVGIAIGTGTDVAIQSADVVLMSGDLLGVPNAVALSRATVRNIKQNLFWAFGYNAALLPVAAGVLFPTYGILLSPILASAAMALSSVFVVGNALRLKAFQAPDSVEAMVKPGGYERLVPAE
jgi:Cu+-exporting ATPase